MTICLHPVAGETNIWGEPYEPKDSYEFLLDYNTTKFRVKINRSNANLKDCILFFFSLSQRTDFPSKLKLSNIVFRTSYGVIPCMKRVFTDWGIVSYLSIDSRAYTPVVHLLTPERQNAFNQALDKTDALIMPFLKKETAIVHEESFFESQTNLSQLRSELEGLRAVQSVNIRELDLVIDKMDFLIDTVVGYRSRIFPLHDQILASSDRILPLYDSISLLNNSYLKQLYYTLYDALPEMNMPLISVIAQYAISRVKRIGKPEALEKTKEEDQAADLETVTLL